MSDYKYSDTDLDAVYRVISERRDIRHFLPDPVDEAVLVKLLKAAHQAPSVGLMEPWRFIRITQQDQRDAIHACVQREALKTAEALGERKEAFLRLKVEGVLSCGELIVLALPPDREKHVFGRRTLPEMDLASAACAVQNFWLAARAEGLGLGWVSIFEPKELGNILQMPEGSLPIAILCLGHVKEFYPEPLLVTEKWTTSEALEKLVFYNRWENTEDV